jgi:hypothetical protein
MNILQQSTGTTVAPEREAADPSQASLESGIRVAKKFPSKNAGNRT